MQEVKVSSRLSTNAAFTESTGAFDLLNSKAMITTVIGYSSAHFDPDTLESLYPNSSAAFLASAIHRAASNVSDRVIYVDASKSHTWPKVGCVDFLIGIESGFSKLVAHFNPGSKLLFAVNQQYDCTLNKLLKPLVSGSLPTSSLFGSQDFLNRDKEAETLADKILIVGDNVTLGTYLTTRDMKDLHVVPYSYAPSYLSPKQDLKAISILIPASTIGVRKGSDFIAEICRKLKVHKLDNIRVITYGAASNRYWRAQIRRWSLTYPLHFQYLGWIEPSSMLSRETHARASCSVLPSREEGLVGTGIETILANIPTFASQECGLGLRDPDFLLRTGNVSNWANQVIQYCLNQTPVTQLDESRQSSIRHAGYTAVESAIQRFILSNEIQPRLWFRRLGEILQLSANEQDTFMPISESLRFLPKDEFDAVSGAIGLLESNFTDKLITLIQTPPSSATVVAGVSRNRLIHFACGTVENTGVLNFLIDDSQPQEMLVYFYVEPDPVEVETFFNSRKLRTIRIRVMLKISMLASVFRRALGRIFRLSQVRFGSCLIRKYSPK
jgi:hypothetical protein